MRTRAEVEAVMRILEQAEDEGGDNEETYGDLGYIENVRVALQMCDWFLQK